MLHCVVDTEKYVFICLFGILSVQIYQYSILSMAIIPLLACMVVQSALPPAFPSQYQQRRGAF